MELKRNEGIRLHLDLPATPDGYPTPSVKPKVRIEKNGTQILDWTDMTEGVSGMHWYYDHTVASGAAVGTYQVLYSAVINGATLYDTGTDTFSVTISDLDDIKSAVDSISTGTGSYNATINVKDDNLINVANAKVTIHNSNDDDSPIIASGITDPQGNVTLNIDGSVYVRVSKAGFSFTSTSINVTASGTYNVSGMVVTYSQPTDPDLCRLYVYPITLDNQDVSGLKIYIFSKESLTKVNGEFINNASLEFTYDNTTSPDSYYFDAVQGTNVHLSCALLGIDHEITVPAVSSKDLNDLIA